MPTYLETQENLSALLERAREEGEDMRVEKFNMYQTKAASRLMRIASVMLGVLIISASALAQANKTGTFKFEKKAGSHLVRVVFHTRTFERSRHKITGDATHQTSIDGRPAIGTDGNFPKVEIDSMRVYFDGQEIKIPSRLYADCFEPHLDKDDVKLKVGSDFQSVTIEMLGSDGAGGYEMTWRLKKNGRHSRSVEQP
jgi:hypothetical protein